MNRSLLYFLFLLIPCFVCGQRGPAQQRGPAYVKNEFGLAEEWLYALPAYDLPYFAGVVDIEPAISQVHRFHNEKNWHSGYRVEAMYGCNAKVVQQGEPLLSPAKVFSERD